MQRYRRGFSLIILALAGAAFFTAPARAEDDLEMLKQQVERLQKRVQELEAAHPAEPVQPANPADALRAAPRAWDPFEEIRAMQEQMDRMFENSFGRSGLNQGIFKNQLTFDYDFDIKETETAYQITFDMTGLDERRLDVEINDRSITVKGQQDSQQEVTGEEGIFSSRSFGSFSKTIPVPPDADTSRARTERQGKNLVITLPKKPAI